AGAHHGGEGVPVTAPAGQAVADRLVVLPPGMPGQHHVLLGRRYLDRRHPGWAEVRGALGRYRLPWPLAQVHGHVPGRPGRVGIGPAGGHAGQEHHTERNARKDLQCPCRASRGPHALRATRVAQPPGGAAAVEPRTTSSGRNRYSVCGAPWPRISSTSARTAAAAIARTGWRTVVSGGSVNAIKVESS